MLIDQRPNYHRNTKGVFNPPPCKEELGQKFPPAKEMHGE
jgi:hypothetical protein